MSSGTLGLGILLSVRDLASAPLARVERSFASLDERVGLGAVHMGRAFSGLGGNLTALAGGALAALGLTKAVSLAGAFEEEVAKVGAVSRASADELEALSTAALDAGVATQFSPIAAARGLRELASAGFDARESIALLIPSLDLAAASFEELTPSTAAGLAAQATKAFGLSATDATSTVDRLIQSVNIFALSAGELPLALGVASRGAQTLGQSLDETLISLGLVRAVIPTTERAATAVAVAMERLANTGVQARLAGVGVAVTDAHGRFRDFLDVIADLGPRLAALSERQRASFLLQVFGTDALAGAQAIMTQLKSGVRNAAGEMVHGGAAVAVLRDQLAHADGAAARFRDTMLQTFAGQKRQLAGSLETLAILIGASFAQVLSPVLRVTTALVNGLIHVVRTVPEPVRRAAAAVVVAAVALAGLAAAIVLVHRGMGLLRLGLALGRTAIVEFVAALGPVGLVLAALALVVAGVVTAFQRDLGGIATLFRSVAHDVGLAVRGVAQLFASGELSGAVREELARVENRGLKQFAIGVYMLAYRLAQFGAGVRDGFVAAIDEARPAFDALVAAFHELGAELAGLVGDLTGAANALPSAQFVSFGQVVGAVFGTITAWVVRLVGWITRFTAGVVGGFRAMEQYIVPVFRVLGKALGDLRDAFNDLFGLEGDAADGAVTVGDVFRALGEITGTILGAAVTALGVALTVVVKTLEYIVLVIGWVRDAFVAVGSVIGDVAGSISGAFGGVLQVVSAVFAGVSSFFGALASMIRTVVDTIRDAIQALVDALRDAAEMITGFFTDIWDGIGDIGSAVGDAGSAAGGFVYDQASNVVHGIFDSPFDGLLAPSSAADSPAAAAVPRDLTIGQVQALMHAQRAVTQVPATILVQLHVDGAVLAKTVVTAQDDQARRAFTPAPIPTF
jgi:TP901 family phage tail tape measure protein